MTLNYTQQKELARVARLYWEKIRIYCKKAGKRQISNYEINAQRHF